MHDKNGFKIKAGDTLYNPHDLYEFYEVLQDRAGNLYLGDFDSPLDSPRYAVGEFWEVIKSD